MESLTKSVAKPKVQLRIWSSLFGWYQITESPAESQFPLQCAIDEAKRQAIARAFAQAKGDHTVAAKLLGVNQNYL
jgi:hypothetical protein